MPLRSLRTRSVRSIRCELQAASKRLEENANGVLYVNDKCINCAACSHFAPTVFERNADIFKHVVYNQPSLDQSGEMEAARAALAACPVAAIRVESNVHGEDELNQKEALSIQHHKPFPQMMYPIHSADGEPVDIGVYYLGHHNDASFGAVPYLILGKSPEGKDISVMVDVPRFCPSAVRAVKSLKASGPDYIFLTHVDDTADHNKWKEEFPSLKRIFHSGDLGRHNWIGDLTLEDVEVLLREENEKSSDDLVMWDIDGNRLTPNKLDHMGQEEFLILHTPGHSPGSISLLFRPKTLPPNLQSTNLFSNKGKQIKYPSGIICTGDTYAWTTRDGGYMSGFPRYGNNLHIQAETLQKLGSLNRMWDIVAPGHGHPRFYMEHGLGEKERGEVKLGEMNDALKELLSY